MGPAAPPLHHRLSPFDPRRAVWRALGAALAGVGAAWLATLATSPQLAALVGWDVGALVLLAMTWLHIAGNDAAVTHARAAAEDPGRTVVYALVVLTSAVSLLSATLLSRRAHALAPGDEGALVALCLLGVALAWLLTQTSFTLRYAHLYYRDRGAGVGGVVFPGDQRPTYGDFAYFAFTVGMCFQVSDCTVSSAQIRGAVLLHAVLSFAYNSVILAFTLNLVFSAAT
jgi:uncharacterized membrane protein